MPRLIFFGLSQKAIIDKMDGNVSMIVLLHAIHIQFPEGQTVPIDMVAPLPWASVATWHPEAEDTDKAFQSKIELLSPSGAVHTTLVGEPFMLPGRVYTSVSNSPVTPVGEQGIYTVKAYLREIAEGSDWNEHGQAEISVFHILQKEGQGG